MPAAYVSPTRTAASPASSASCGTNDSEFVTLKTSCVEALLEEPSEKSATCVLTGKSASTRFQGLLLSSDDDHDDDEEEEEDEDEDEKARGEQDDAVDRSWSRGTSSARSREESRASHVLRASDCSAFSQRDTLRRRPRLDTCDTQAPTASTSSTGCLCTCSCAARKHEDGTTVGLEALPPPPPSRPKQMSTSTVMMPLPVASQTYEDVEIRYALNLRIVDVDTSVSPVLFAIRVEDVETKTRWVVKRSVRQLAQFYRHVRAISATDAPVKKDLWGSFRALRHFHLPTKFLHFRDTLNQQRRAVFDSFLRHTAALVSPAPLGPRRRRAILLLQEFVDVDKHIKATRPRCECCQCGLRAWSESCSPPDATQLVEAVFMQTSHAIVDDAHAFVAQVTRQTRERLRTRLCVKKAQALLKTISREMAALKARMLQDPRLRIRLFHVQSLLSDSRYDDYVEDVRHAICGLVQKLVFIQLEDHVYEALATLCPVEKEKELKERMRVLQTMPQSFFGISSPWISKDDWESARRELHNIDDFSLPLDRLKCIVRAASAIFQSCATMTSSSSSSSSSSSCSMGECESHDASECGMFSLATDEFLPIYMFVVVTTNTSKPLLTRQLLQLMCDHHDVTGEIGYYLTNYEAAIEYVRQAELPR